MKLLVRTFLALAALTYAAMPFAGMAAVTPAGPGGAVANMVAEVVETGQTMPGHAKQAVEKVPMDTVSSDADCPHTDLSTGKLSGKSDRALHCAACLTLAADLRIATFGRQARAAEAQTIMVVFTSWPAAPLDPPPRV
ncbi:MULTISPECIES: hypothetical protein [Alphaproteobacteria]|uniref:Uncharacterized protein n=2 Tax=Alphaproteobacteria TaxID=28211 RepID=A0A512HI49_9HYPH|nr:MULTISPECIES: hypothetical protein [Alphaproteobacteria]GEO85126.1 hypothetical protein RNA01_20580 [Ciceribacter naphthalenivorans]GLR24540.1 hypothetical protein GCM10007920_43340 [Ciceribacter naphthalenivorans]GLT07396.1 hypothetical protein GCM10007926_43340 [Sphingomonas psychrolutea]